MQWRGESYLGFESKKSTQENEKEETAEKHATTAKFSRGGLYCDIEFLSVPSLTIA